MNNDFVNKALESAKALQQSVAEAVSKGAVQAKPIVADAVSRAQDLQKTIIEQAPHVSEAAQGHLQTAQGYLTTFISTGKDVLAKSVEGAQAGLAPLADNARQAVHEAANTISAATAPKPPAPPAS